jgi:Thioesterase-like superfamily
VRPGKKVQLVEASLHAEDVEVARATLLRIRTVSMPLPPEAAGGDTTPPDGPEGVALSKPAWLGELRAYHSHATEHRVLRGSWTRIGPCTDWVRVRVPLFEGVPLSPFERVAAAADFGNGIGAALPFEQYRFLNADLTLHLHRLPVGEWVCLDAVSYPEPAGVGVAESALFDQKGRLGRALQSLLIERR